MKLVEVAVATIDTQLPGKAGAGAEHAVAGLGGAVYTAVATPSLLVTIDRADSVP